ncbi:MAG: hypothetical protein ACLVES_00730 [Faecalibacterium prausnitzii]
MDAGGQGIMIIFEGMGKVFHGEDIVAGWRSCPQTRPSSPPRTPARASSPTT